MDIISVTRINRNDSAVPRIPCPQIAGVTLQTENPSAPLIIITHQSTRFAAAIVEVARRARLDCIATFRKSLPKSIEIQVRIDRAKFVATKTTDVEPRPVRASRRNRSDLLHFLSGKRIRASQKCRYNQDSTET